MKINGNVRGNETESKYMHPWFTLVFFFFFSIQNDDMVIILISLFGAILWSQFLFSLQTLIEIAYHVCILCKYSYGYSTFLCYFIIFIVYM